MHVEDIRSSNNENPDFVVTQSVQTNILTSNPGPNLMPVIPQQYLETAAMLLFPNLERKLLSLVTATLRELNALILITLTFSGANSKQLDHYIIPTLVDKKPDVVLLHVGKNDILSNAKDTELANNIINIELNCKNHDVSKVFISSILVKENPKLNHVIRRVNDQLRELCEINGFLFF